MGGLILVTGATGFIGSHLTKYLLKKGERTRALVRDPNKLKAFGLDREGNLEAVKGDLLKTEDVSGALNGVDRLFHTAGFVSTYPKDKEKVLKLNYDITCNLFKECGKKELKKIVYLASIFALGGGSPEPVNEDAPYNLDDLDVAYVKAKRRAEVSVREQIRKGLPVVRVYPCYCYGPGDVNSSSSRLILSYLKCSLVGYIRGGQNVTDVRDAAEGLYLAMNKGKIGQKYIVGGENLSYVEIFTLLDEVTGYHKPRFVMSRRAGRFFGFLNQTVSSSPFIDREAAELMGHYWYYDDTRARKELGYSSRPTTDTLRDMIRWLCSRGMAPWPPGMKNRGKFIDNRRLP